MDDPFTRRSTKPTMVFKAPEAVHQIPNVADIVSIPHCSYWFFKLKSIAHLCYYHFVQNSPLCTRVDCIVSCFCK